MVEKQEASKGTIADHQSLRDEGESSRIINCKARDSIKDEVRKGGQGKRRGPRWAVAGAVKGSDNCG